jgi:hypothetical protein
VDRRLASHEYPLHERAVRRHVAWAREFASVGDLVAVADELEDIWALVAELDDAGWAATWLTHP